MTRALNETIQTPCREEREMMRWWREFRNPRLKCERLGHKVQQLRYTGYSLPERNGVGYRFRAVAVAIEVTFYVCSRCKWEDREKQTMRDLGGIQSLGMQESDWSELRTKGILLRRSV